MGRRFNNRRLSRSGRGRKLGGHPDCRFHRAAVGNSRDDVLETYWGELESGLREVLSSSEGLDGIWLALHGAMVTRECEDPEGELLWRIRRCRAQMPFRSSECSICMPPSRPKWRTTPTGSWPIAKTPTRMRAKPRCDRHIFLSRALETGSEAAMMSRTAPVIWPPTGTGTADRPMRDLEELARRIEGRSLDLGRQRDCRLRVFRRAGCRSLLLACHVGERAPQRRRSSKSSRPLSACVNSACRTNGILMRPSPGQRKRPGPMIIVEPSDNIGGGAPGDGTAVLRGLLRHGIGNAAVAIADAEAVKAFRMRSPGKRGASPSAAKEANWAASRSRSTPPWSASATVASR